MKDRVLGVCDECGSEFIISISKMKSLCPNCAHMIYGYANCSTVFKTANVFVFLGRQRKPVYKIIETKIKNAPDGIFVILSRGRVCYYVFYIPRIFSGMLTASLFALARSSSEMPRTPQRYLTTTPPMTFTPSGVLK